MEVIKWVATKQLVEIPLQRSILLQLEVQKLLLVNRHLNEGIHILTVKGCH